ncbi:MAG: tRNA (guanosine(37)-N1)-methyltransferase TrmD [Deltaproteobacteria bacterium]|nr:tRNA (guanosine(37)-N1)-methyltransferase TrmD [Deltaproteobacteria bacterium]
MRFEILTLFPQFFSSPLKESVVGHAIERGIIEVRTHNIRDYATDKHRTTDDAPYGGGPGMVMKVEPVVRALESIVGKRGPETAVILTTPQGGTFNHKAALRLSGLERVVIVCGRYEGVDERIRAFAGMEISVGDYVLTGGEIPALAIIDCVARLIPGFLGDDSSAKTESFAEGLLEYPQYTRPEEFRGMRVPPVLLSGNHFEIERWRRKESLRRTLERRPELLGKTSLCEEDKEFIKELTGS